MDATHELRALSLRRRRSRNPRAGFTLIEILIAVPLVLLAITMFASTMTASARQRSVNRENALVSDAVQTLFEEMRNEEIAGLLALYNAEPFDDPLGPGTAPGNLFRIEGLEALPDAPNGMVGEIVFPMIDTAAMVPAVWELREDVQMPGLGMPRDLNGDSLIDDQDHSGDYLILPVEVRVRWNGQFGDREFRMHTALIEFAS